MDVDMPGPYIVKVRYASMSTGQISDREYSYFSVDQLEVGNFVQVPVNDRVQLAQVTQVDVPYREIESFVDRMKTIPSGSKRPAPEPEEPTQSVPTAYPDNYEESPKDELFEKEVDQEEGAPGFETDLPTEAEIAEAEEAVLAEDVSRELDPLSRPDSSLLRSETTVKSDDQDAAEMFEAHNQGTAVIAVQPGIDGAILALYAEGEKALEYARARIIETNDDLKSATDDLVSIKNLRESMEAKRLNYVRPIRAHLDAVNLAFKDLTAPFEEANQITRGKVNEFRAIERAKVELQEREAKAKAGATTIERQAPVPEITRTGLGTAGSRTVWHFEIQDFAQVPDEYKLPNDSKILAHARTTKGKRPIPGIKMWSEKEVTVRRKGGN